MMAWQVIAIALIGALAGVESVLDEWQFHRPLIASTLIGWVLGDVHVGLVVGATLELIALGWMNIGAAQSPDTALASVIATVLAIRGGSDTTQAIALGVPLAVAGNLTTVFVRTVTVYFQHMADRIGPQSRKHYLGYIHFGALTLQALRVAIPAWLFAQYVSQSMILHLFQALPQTLTDGFTAASGFIVVVGYAMVIRSLQVGLLMPYFFLGFLIADFSKITLLGCGLVAGCLAYLHVRVFSKANEGVATEGFVDAQTTLREIPRIVFWQTFWRSQFMQASWNYERMLSVGYAYTLEPTLDHFYPPGETRQARKVRHLEFFNTQPYVANLVTGINMALEERLQAGDSSFDRMVTSIKMGMMGPLAGVGDSIFWGTLRPLVASLGATIALRGSLLGPILFFVLWNIIRLGTRYSLLRYGYLFGTRIVHVIATGVLRQVTEAATIVGLIVMGALIADWAHISFALQWTLDHGQVIKLNHIIDTLLPKFPQLLLVLFTLYLFRRGWGSVRVILLLFALAIGGVYAHLLAP